MTNALSYAPRPRWHRRLLRRRTVVLAAIAATIIAGGLWGPGLWHHATLLYLQDRCLKAPAPTPQEVVFDTDAERSKQLIAAGRGYRAAYDRVKDVAVPTDYSPAGKVHEPWRRLSEALQTCRPSAATVYLGWRTSPAGHRRLVCVDIAVAPDADRDDPRAINAYTRCAVLDPGSAFRPVRLLTPLSDSAFAAGARTGSYINTPYAIFIGMYVTARPCRILAGQTDPTDPSHIVFRVEDPKYSKLGIETLGKVHCWLRDDDRVVVKLDGTHWGEPVAP